MKIIAKTKEDFLIEASKTEIEAILTALTGVKPKEINIGQLLSGLDYASSITKLKTLKNSYEFRALIDKHNNYINHFNELLAELDSDELSKI